ncbi:MAG: putative transcriptional regulator, DeoR family [Micrococcaceae bacterium]|nr:putative transcriptional regulator, DeoR family [Micrococcaceae bacterium]
MLAPDRHSRIMAELQHSQAVRVADLAVLLHVSEMTIRRDIETLESQGQLRKIHGGATRPGRFSAIEPGFASNADSRLAAKKAIAAEAAMLIHPGMTIGVTGGTTTFQLADLIAARPAASEGLTVITNSLKAAEALYRGSGHGLRVILTGGERTPSEALVGPLARAAVSALNMDVCFLGVHGVDVQRGLTSPNLVEAETNAAFLQAAERTVVLADASKFGVRALAVVAPLGSANVLITDGDASPTTIAAYRPHVGELRTVPISTAPAASAATTPAAATPSSSNLSPTTASSARRNP